MTDVPSFIGSRAVSVDESSSPQLDSPSFSDSGVVAASTLLFPMNVWLCERPGSPGKRIGSSLLRWLKLQPME